MKQVKETIYAKGLQIGIYTNDFENEFISLTDIAKYKSDEPSSVIQNWMRSRDVIEFLGLWEQLHNQDFKPLEFEGFRQQAGLHAFTMSPKKWIEGVNAIGIVSKSGRYGGGVYADEADLLNVVLFGKTAKEWRKENPDKKGNIRDFADLNRLLVLANLESYNAILIEQGISQENRMELLQATAKRQLKAILGIEKKNLPEK